MDIQVGRRLFEFHSKANWVAKAAGRYGGCGLPAYLTIAIDAHGRICRQGLHFSQAEADGAYPVTVYVIRPDVEPAT